MSSPIYWAGCAGRTLVQSRKPDAEAEQVLGKYNKIFMSRDTDIFELIECGGGTSEDIAAELGIPIKNASAGLSDLYNLEMIDRRPEMITGRHTTRTFYWYFTNP